MIESITLFYIWSNGYQQGHVPTSFKIKAFPVLSLMLVRMEINGHVLDLRVAEPLTSIFCFESVSLRLSKELEL